MIQHRIIWAQAGDSISWRLLAARTRKHLGGGRGAQREVKSRGRLQVKFFV